LLEWLKLIRLKHIYFNMLEEKFADMLTRNAIKGILDWIGSEAVHAIERMDYEQCKEAVGWPLRNLRLKLVSKERMGYLTPEERKLLNILRKKWSDIIDAVCRTHLDTIKEEVRDILTRPTPIEELLEKLYEDWLTEKLADIETTIKEVIKQAV